LRLGNVYAKIKEYPKAEALYKQIITDNPYYSDAYINLAILNSIFGHNAKAIELFGYALALGTDDPTAVCYNLSRQYALIGDRAMADQYYRRAKSAKP